jgi:hypothetical protein
MTKTKNTTKRNRQSKRKFYKTEVKVTILSESDLGGAGGLSTLGEIDFMITDGDCSGKVEVGDSQRVDGRTMAKLLREQGSDPGFFQLTEDGADTKD